MLINKLNHLQMQRNESGRRPFFVVLNSRGLPQCKVSFMSREESLLYEEWLSMERQRLLMAQQKEMEESTNELEF
jgi:hypothetical protein